MERGQRGASCTNHACLYDSHEWQTSILSIGLGTIIQEDDIGDLRFMRIAHT